MYDSVVLIGWVNSGTMCGEGVGGHSTDDPDAVVCQKFCPDMKEHADFEL